MVVVDGRVDREKLSELLTFEAEQEALDFKATLDLADPVSGSASWPGSGIVLWLVS